MKSQKLKIDENSFELSLRILGNEFVAIKIGQLILVENLMLAVSFIIFYANIIRGFWSKRNFVKMSVETFFKMEDPSKIYDVNIHVILCLGDVLNGLCNSIPQLLVNLLSYQSLWAL